MSATVKKCPRCGDYAEIVQLDSGHWVGACMGACGLEGTMHWSKVEARKLWNTTQLGASDAHA